ncbi:MAG: PBSX family phage terminase large subunit [Eubacteriales bacterium]
MILSNKQKEFINHAPARWNFKGGATRSGKTHIDLKYTIPLRIRERSGKDGLNVILGNTRGTLQRNVIGPMQTIFGSALVGDIRSDNTVRLFGDTAYCLGADNKKHVDKIRGSSIKFCYGDEVTTWNEETFGMLKSRLDKSYSCFDGTFNPDNPLHWLKKFLDSNADIYNQSYTINDNPFLDPAFVANLKKEYYGTVYYDRYINGLWVAAEGVIYRSFADNPERFIIKDIDPAAHNVVLAIIGVDFGGNGSAHSFTCVGFTPGYKMMICLEEFYLKEVITPAYLESQFTDFVRMCKTKYKNISDAYCDSAEQTLIQGLRTTAGKNRLAINVVNSHKYEINDRIRCMARLMAVDRFKITARCKHTIDALRAAVWDSEELTRDKRLDDGNYNIDSLDSMEYAYETHIRDLVGIM